MPDPASAAAGPSVPPQEEPSELREYLAVLRLRKWSIIAITALTVVAALFFSFRQTPIYESETQVLVHPVPVSGSTSAVPAPPNLDTERTVASSGEVAELAAEQLGGAADPEDLLEDLSVEVATNSEVLVIRYAHTSPLEAQRRSGAFAESYLAFRRQQILERVVAAQEGIQEQIIRARGRLRQVSQDIAATDDEVRSANLEALRSQLAAQLAVLQQQQSEASSITEIPVADIIAQADLPSSPASPNHVLNGALALLVGLALGVGLAFLRERLDDRLRGQADLEARAGAPVLAVVPRIPSWKKGGETPIVAATDPKSGPAEAYRTLRTSLLFAAAERGLRVIMVTSPHPGEGKTATVANLAVVLAESGRRVVAISADLRKPRLHRFFRALNRSGLSLLLTGEDSFREAVQDVGVPNLRLVASGPVPQNPAELLGSHAMARALERFRDASDVVIIDAPPVLDVADTMTMAPFTDAVVLVADAEKTSRGALSHARRQLDQVKAEVIGAVLNNLDPSKARTYPYYYRYYYRYGYTYSQQEAEDRKGRRRQEPVEEEPVLPPPDWFPNGPRPGTAGTERQEPEPRSEPETTPPVDAPAPTASGGPPAEDGPLQQIWVPPGAQGLPERQPKPPDERLPEAFVSPASTGEPALDEESLLMADLLDDIDRTGAPAEIEEPPPSGDAPRFPGPTPSERQ